VCFFSKANPLTSDRAERFRTANKSWWIAVVTRPICRIARAITSVGAKVTCRHAGRFLGLGSANNKTLQEAMSTSDTTPKIVKSEAEWRAQLTPVQFHVTRQHRTGRALPPQTSDLLEP
jgi:hypothetical protein